MEKNHVADIFCSTASLNYFEIKSKKIEQIYNFSLYVRKK